MNDILDNVKSFLQTSLQRTDIPDDIRCAQGSLLEQLSDIKADDKSSTLRSTDSNFLDQSDDVTHAVAMATYYDVTKMNTNDVTTRKSSDITRADSLLHGSSHCIYSRSRSRSIGTFLDHSPPPSSVNKRNKSLDFADYYSSIDDTNEKLPGCHNHNKDADESGSSTSYESYEGSSVNTRTCRRVHKAGEGRQPSSSARTSTEAPSPDYETGDIQSPRKSNSPKKQSAFFSRMTSRWSSSRSSVVLDPPVTLYKEKKKQGGRKVLNAVLGSLPRSVTFPRPTNASSSTSPSHNASTSRPLSQSYSTASLSPPPISPQQIHQDWLPVHSGFLYVRSQKLRATWISRMAILTSQSLCLYKVGAKEIGSGETRHSSGISLASLGNMSCVSSPTNKSSFKGKWADSQLINVYMLEDANIILVSKVGERHHVLKLEVSEGRPLFVSTDTLEELEEWKQHLKSVADGLQGHGIEYASSPIGQSHDNSSHLSSGHRSNLHGSKSSVYTTGSQSSSFPYSSYSPWEKNSSMYGSSVQLRENVREALHDVRRRMTSVVGRRSARTRSSSRSSVRASMVVRPGDEVQCARPLDKSDTIYGNLTQDPSNVTMTGHLMVHSPLLGDDGWHFRFCLISRGMFSVYRRQEDFKAQLQFPLFGCSLESDISAVNKCRILVTQGGKLKIALEAPDSWALGQWMTALVRLTQVPPPPESDPEDVQDPSSHVDTNQDLTYDIDNNGYEKSTGERLMTKLSQVRSHLINSSPSALYYPACSSPYPVCTLSDPQSGSSKDLISNSTTPRPHSLCTPTNHYHSLPPQPEGMTRRQVLNRRQSSLLRRSYENLIRSRRPVLQEGGSFVEEGGSLEDKKDDISTDQYQSLLDDMVLRHCYSENDIWCPIREPRLRQRVVNDLLPALLRARLAGVDDVYESDWPLSTTEKETQRDSVLSNESVVFNLPKAESTQYFACASSTSAYSSMGGHPASRTNSGGAYDVTRRPRLETKEMSNTQDEYSIDVQERERLQENDYEIQCISPPLPLPVRSKPRRPGPDIESIVSRFVPSRRKSRAPSLLLRHHPSLSSVALSRRESSRSHLHSASSCANVSSLSPAKSAQVINSQTSPASQGNLNNIQSFSSVSLVPSFLSSVKSKFRKRRQSMDVSRSCYEPSRPHTDDEASRPHHDNVPLPSQDEMTPARRVSIEARDATLRASAPMPVGDPSPAVDDNGEESEEADDDVVGTLKRVCTVSMADINSKIEGEICIRKAPTRIRSSSSVPSLHTFTSSSVSSCYANIPEKHIYSPALDIIESSPPHDNTQPSPPLQNPQCPPPLEKSFEKPQFTPSLEKSFENSQFPQHNKKSNFSPLHVKTQFFPPCDNIQSVSPHEKPQSSSPDEKTQFSPSHESIQSSSPHENAQASPTLKISQTTLTLRVESPPSSSKPTPPPRPSRPIKWLERQASNMERKASLTEDKRYSNEVEHSKASFQEHSKPKLPLSTPPKPSAKPNWTESEKCLSIRKSSCS